MAKLKVAHLTSVHRADDVRIFHKECKTLAKAGYEVVYIVPHCCDITEGGVRIRAVPQVRGRLKRMISTVWQVFRAALGEKAQLYHFHDPELIPAGMLLKIMGKRVIYDVHEDLPRQILTKSWIPGRLRRPAARFAEILEYISAAVFDGIAVANASVAHRFPKKKRVTVQNFPLLNEFLPGQNVPYHRRQPLIAYVGAISFHRGIREMVDMLPLLSGHTEVRLALAGIFSPSGLEKEVEILPGWKQVQYLGCLNRREVAVLMGRARIGIIPLHPIPNYLSNYPVKLFEYMAAGLPVVVSDIPLWREIVEEADCGLLVEPKNPYALAKAVGWLLEHPEEAEVMGRRGREAVLGKYNWGTEAKKLIAFYEEKIGLNNVGKNF